MSIINEALKKAQRDHQVLPISKQNILKNLDQESRRKKHGFNWGPVFVLSVLILITGPILAPMVASFFRPQMSTYGPVSAPVQVAQAPQTNRVAATDNRKPQFGVEEAPLIGGGAPKMMEAAQRPYLNLTGIVYSPSDAYCIINDKVVKTGDNVLNAKLVEITPEQAVLDYRGHKITLRMTAA